MTDVLDVLMNQVLAEFSIISEQRAHSYDGIIVNGGEHDHTPSLSAEPLADEYRRRFSNAKSQFTRRKVVLEAIQALQQARRAPLPVGMEPAYGSPQWKRYIGESTEDAGQLATRFHCTRRYINQIRAQYRR